MNDVINTVAHLILNNIRTLGGIACAVVMMVGLQSLVHHLVAEQTANAAMFDQLTRPQSANVAMVTAPQQQWIPLQ